MSILLLLFCFGCYLNLGVCASSGENFEKPCIISRIAIAKSKTKFWAKITLDLLERVHEIESIVVTRCKYSDKKNTIDCVQKFKDVRDRGDVLSCMVKYDEVSKEAAKDSNFKVLIEEKKIAEPIVVSEPEKSESTPRKKIDEELKSLVVLESKSDKKESGSPNIPAPEKEAGKKKKEPASKIGEESETKSSIPFPILIVISVGLIVVGTLVLVKMARKKKEEKPVISRATTAKKLPIEDDPRKTTKSIIEEIRKTNVYQRSGDERWNQFMDDVLMAQFACKKLDLLFPQTPYALTYGTLSPRRKAPDLPNVLLLWNGRPEEYNPSGSKRDPTKQEFLAVRFHFQGGPGRGRGLSDGWSIPFDVEREEMMVNRRSMKFLESRGVKALGFRMFKTRVFLVKHFNGDDKLGSGEFKMFRKARLGMVDEEGVPIEGDKDNNDNLEEEEEVVGYRDEDDGEEEGGGGEQRNNQRNYQLREEELIFNGDQSVSEHDLAETRDEKSLQIFYSNTDKLLDDEDVKFARFVIEKRKLVFKGYPYLFDSKVFDDWAHGHQRSGRRRRGRKRRRRISFVFGNAEGEWLVVVVRKCEEEGEKLLKESENAVPKASESIRGMGRKITLLCHAAVTLSDLDESLQSEYNKN